MAARASSAAVTAAGSEMPVFTFGPLGAAAGGWAAAGPAGGTAVTLAVCVSPVPRAYVIASSAAPDTTNRPA